MSERVLWIERRGWGEGRSTCLTRRGPITDERREGIVMRAFLTAAEEEGLRGELNARAEAVARAKARCGERPPGPNAPPFDPGESSHATMYRASEWARTHPYRAGEKYREAWRRDLALVMQSLLSMNQNERYPLWDHLAAAYRELERLTEPEAHEKRMHSEEAAKPRRMSCFAPGWVSPSEARDNLVAAIREERKKTAADVHENSMHSRPEAPALHIHKSAQDALRNMERYTMKPEPLGDHPAVREALGLLNRLVEGLERLTEPDAKPAEVHEKRMHPPRAPAPKPTVLTVHLDADTQLVINFEEASVRWHFGKALEGKP